MQYSLNNITFLDKVCYDTYVGEVYVDLENGICHLIELNPFGCLDAALFNWIDDYDLLHGLSQPEFRYLSVINF